MKMRPNILFLAYWFPWPIQSGNNLRVYHLLVELSKSCDIILVAFQWDRKADLDGLRDVCREIHLVPQTSFNPGRFHGWRELPALASPLPRSFYLHHSAQMAETVRRCVEQQPIDLIIASQFPMAPYALNLGVPVLFEEVQIAVLQDRVAEAKGLVERLRSHVSWRKFSGTISRLMAGCVASTVVSEQERALVQPLAPPGHPISVIANGIDPAANQGPWPAIRSNVLVYPGSLTFGANYDAMCYFIDRIWPHVRAENPLATLRITGHSTADHRARLSASGVEFTGFLPDVRPEIASAWATVVPLRVGGGTRLKILESMALGTPVISTSKGAEGLAVTAGQEIIIADSPPEFARAIISLLGNPEQRKALSVQGRKQITNMYDWAIIGQQLRELVQNLTMPVRRGIHE